MENTATLVNIQVTKRELLQFRLRKIKRSTSWLATEIGSNQAYVSQYLNHGYYPQLEEKIISAIEKEENRTTSRNSDSNLDDAL